MEIDDDPRSPRGDQGTDVGWDHARRAVRLRHGAAGLAFAAWATLVTLRALVVAFWLAIADVWEETRLEAALRSLLRLRPKPPEG